MEIISIFRSQLEEIEERELDDCEEYEIHNQNLGKDAIVMYGPFYKLPAYGLIVGTGTYYAYNETTRECEPDFAITAVYLAPDSDKDFDPNQPIYWEQDGVEITLHNFFTILESRSMTAKELATAV